MKGIWIMGPDEQTLIAPSMKRFALVYIATIVGIVVLTIALDYLFEIDIQNSGMAMIPAMIAAADAGTQFTAKNNATPQPKYSWRISRKMLLVELLIEAVLAVLYFPIAINLLSEIEPQTPFVIFLVIIVVQLLVVFLCNRLFFSMGAKNKMKSLEKLSR